jgi:hypothetical protein
MKHGLNLTMNSFKPVQRRSGQHSQAVQPTHMVAEVRRDMKIMDSDHDDWSQKRRPGKHQEDTYFSTYNTLTNV